MKRIAKFEKVSLEQFVLSVKDFLPSLNEEEIKVIYEQIKLPKRATKLSAGYDFYSYSKLVLKPNQTLKVPTGIRCKMDEDYVLFLAPRSSLGFKYRLQLDNTIGVIDSDYYNAKNEGHIFIKITNDTKEEKEVLINEFEAFAQGIFLQYGITVDDDTDEERIGGFGSTNK
jgi:dUTP pyrophosphatase